MVFCTSEILFLCFPSEVFSLHTDLLGRGVCLCVPILGPTGCVQLCDGVSADVGSAPVSSNNIYEVSDLQNISSSFSLLCVTLSA